MTGATIYYAVSNADGFPALMRAGAAEERRGGSRGGRSATGPRFAATGSCSMQLERVRSVALYSDLYAVRADGRSRRRLTRDARAADPDLSPDGRRIVCTVQAVGRRALALVDFPPSGLATPRLLIDDPDADYSGPRWSPDGRRIVAARRRAGVYELVARRSGDAARSARSPRAATRASSRRRGRRTAARCSLPPTSGMRRSTSTRWT